MTTEPRREEVRSSGQAVEAGVTRLRKLWPSILSGPEIIGEYRRVLAKAPDAETVGLVVDRVIDSTTDGYLPRPGTFVAAIDEVATRRRRETAANRVERPVGTARWIDECALIDALAFLEGAQPADRDYAETQVQSIRKRLPDRGAMAEERVKVHHSRAPNHPGDPSGTVRFAVMVDGASDPADEFPRGPLNGGMAALIPIAAVVISGAWRVIGA